MNNKTSHMKPNEAESEKEGEQYAVLHERVVLCCRMARLLHHALTGITWPCVRFADRSHLARALTQLESDTTLARTVAVTPRKKRQRKEAGRMTGIDTAKAASSGEV